MERTAQVFSSPAIVRWCCTATSRTAPSVPWPESSRAFTAETNSASGESTNGVRGDFLSVISGPSLGERDLRSPGPATHDGEFVAPPLVNAAYPAGAPQPLNTRPRAPPLAASQRVTVPQHPAHAPAASTRSSRHRSPSSPSTPTST